MAEYIERKAVREMLENASMISDGEYCGYLAEDIRLDSIPTEDVVPASKLRGLRDVLCEVDQITLQGIAKINRLLAMHESDDPSAGENGKETARWSCRADKFGKDEWWDYYYECRNCGCQMMVYDRNGGTLPRCCPICGIRLEVEDG